EPDVSFALLSRRRLSWALDGNEADTDGLDRVLRRIVYSEHLGTHVCPGSRRCEARIARVDGTGATRAARHVLAVALRVGAWPGVAWDRGLWSHFLRGGYLGSHRAQCEMMSRHLTSR